MSWRKTWSFYRYSVAVLREQNLRVPSTWPATVCALGLGFGFAHNSWWAIALQAVAVVLGQWLCTAAVRLHLGLAILHGINLPEARRAALQDQFLQRTARR